jgi:hypothetical protein
MSYKHCIEIYYIFSENLNTIKVSNMALFVQNNVNCELLSTVFLPDNSEITISEY